MQTRAKAMRHEATPAEGIVWQLLRDRRLEGCKFRRQLTIEPYIVDFVCLEQRLIVEVDGGQHSDSKLDERRDAFLRAEGFSVLRFWKYDVLTNPAGVFDMIMAALTAPHPPKPSAWAPPSPAGGEGLGASHG
ncbi:MAG: endonuclease domain-containing protein [Sphingomonas sp.]|nr:endonuclease domain-containing protein [Sphingomonas sp.]